MFANQLNSWRMGTVVFAVTVLVCMTGCPTPGGGGNTNTNTNVNTNTNDNSNDNGDDNTNGNGNDNVNDNSDDNGNDNSIPDNDLPTFGVVKTSIPVHVQARVAAGDDIVVFGNSGFGGVDFIIPSANDTVGRGIPNASTFRANSFAVSGKKIALVSNFQVTIFDTETDRMDAISTDDVRLTNVPAGLYDAGHIQADGSFVIARSDPTEVTDGHLIQVIDISGSTPQVISFTRDPSPAHQHVLVDGETATAVAVANEIFFVYDIGSPDDEPVQFAAPGGIGSTPPKIDGGFILFHDDSNITTLLNLADGSFTAVAPNPSFKQLALAGGSFGYFVDNEPDDRLGVTNRSAVGIVATLSIVVAAQRDFIDGSTTNNGAIGYGETMGITTDGLLWFIAGSEGVGSGEFLQVTTGGDFEVVADPTGEDSLGCPATDVSVSANVVAFKTGNNTATVLGYAILDN